MKKIRIQGMGMREAKPAGEFKVGDMMLWNFGYKSTVVGIEKETAKTVTFRLNNGERKFLKTRLVAIACS